MKNNTEENDGAIESTVNPVAKFFGWLFLASGILLAVGAGLCSSYFIISCLPGGDFCDIVFLGALVIGGMSILVGLLLRLGGKALLRPRKKRQETASPNCEPPPPQ